MAFFNSFVVSKWPSKKKIADLIMLCENTPNENSKYHITMIHAEDDYDIPRTHSETPFWHAANASIAMGISYDDLEKEKE